MLWPRSYQVGQKWIKKVVLLGSARFYEKLGVTDTSANAKLS